MWNVLIEYREWIGYCAGALATLAFLPQVAKTVRQRNAQHISLGMYVLFCSGVSLWLLYGILMSAWPVIVSNALTLVLSSTVLVLKIKHG